MNYPENVKIVATVQREQRNTTAEERYEKERVEGETPSDSRGSLEHVKVADTICGGEQVRLGEEERCRGEGEKQGVGQMGENGQGRNDKRTNEWIIYNVMSK